MKDQLLRVLMVEDSENDVLLIIRELKKGGYNLVYERVETGAAMNKALQEKQWDIILCDYSLPKFNAPSAIAVLKKANIDIPIIIVSGTIGEDVAIECMRLGAQDYIMKGNLSRLCPAIARELEEAEVRNKQRQAEEALNRSEEKFRKAFYTSPDSVNINRLEDGIYISINPGFTRIMGYTETDIIGKSSIEYDIWANIEDRQRLVAGLKKDGEVTNLEAAFRTKGGDIRYGLMSASIIDLDGVAHILSITRDITERRQAEEALKESEKKYRLLADHVGDVIFVLDMNLNYTYISPSVKSMRGYEPEEVLKQQSLETLIPSSRDLAIKTLAEIMELEKTEHIGSSQSWTLQLEMRRKDGSTVWTEVKFSFIRDTDQRPVGILGLTRDISERKQAEDALRESEEKYRTILEDMDDVYFEVDIKGNITFVNRSSCKMSGYSEEELLGMSFKKISAPDSIEKVIQYFSEIFLTGKTGKPFLWNLEKKNGEQGFFEIVASLIKDKQGKPVGFRGIGRDVTERKRAETKLQQTLESLNKAVGTTIQVLVSALESRDPYTAGHQFRVADLARTIAMEMGLPQDKIDGIRMAGSIHDIGKLSIPAEILSKPTKLTDLEFSLIKEHPQSGYEMLKDVESPWPLAQIVYQHHERMNGSGYPRKLKEEEIIMEARIMAVADVVESMSSHRPYRPALGVEAALEEIEKNKGILYDNTVTDACLKLFREKNYKIP